MNEYVSTWRKVLILTMLTAPWGLLGLARPSTVAGQGKPDAAKPADKDAKKPSSPPEAINLYADAANAQNQGAFEVAADQWQEFLSKFPKDPLAPKAQHYLGICQVQLKKFEQASATFAAVVKNYPTFEFLEDTYLNWAGSLFSQTDPAKPDSYSAPLAVFRTLVEKYPQGKYLDQGTYFQGECLYNQGKKQEAVAAYQKLVKDFAKSPLRSDGLYALGVTQEELGRFTEASQAYDQFLGEFADHRLATDVRMRKAETLLQTGRVDEAEKLFSQVAQSKDFADADHALSRQAFCLTKQDKYVDAAALYIRLTEAFPQSKLKTDAMFWAGRCYYRADKLAEAQPWLQRVADGGGADAAEAAHWLCRIQLRNKQAPAALALVDKVLPAAKQSPFLVNLLMDRADALYDQPQQRAAATQAYLQVATDHPMHELAPQALYNVAFGGLETRQYEAGQTHAARFLEKYPQHRLAADVRYVLAECQLQLGRHADAEKSYRELVANATEHPDFDSWRLRLGLAVYLQKKYDDVIATLSPLVGTLKSADAIAEAQFLIGASQFYQDRFEPAAAALQASLKAAPQWRQADETLLLLSRAQRKLNQNDAAQGSIQQLLKEFPDSKLLDQAYFRLGEYAAAADNHAAAIEHFDAVLTKYPDSTFVPYAQYGQGWGLMKTGKYAAAAEAFSNLLAKSPQHALAVDARFARGMARRQANDFAGAVADLAEFLKSNPTGTAKSAALYERGLAEVGQKNFASAVTTLTSLLKDDPKYADADKVVYELAWAYKSSDKAVEATAEFQRLAAEFPASPLAAEANFHVGEDRYERKQYQEAIAAYTAARGATPQGEIGEKATYKLGWSHFQLKQYGPALEQFAAQVAAFPAGSLLRDARFMQGECLFRQEKYQEALTALRAAGEGKKLPAAFDVLRLLHAGQSASQLKQWPEAVTLLKALVAAHADSPYLAEAHYELGWARQSQGEREAALQDYEIAASKSRDAVGARARFMMGELLFEAKKHEEAVKQFQRVIFGFGGDNAPPDVRNWQAKSGFEAARCYEVQAGTATDATKKKAALADARKMYQYVVDKHAQHELVADARKRLDAIGKL